MPHILTVKLADRSYDIVIGKKTIRSLPAVLKESAFSKKGAVITDQSVGPHYLPLVREMVHSTGAELVECIVPPGENSKSLAYYGEVLRPLAQARLDRHSFLIALGGGVVGDLAGFVAATYLRGIPFLQIPTTLLAMVDSSVGGKTGINLPEGKNLVGCFHQPDRVIIDFDLLETLEGREYRAGLAEVVKYGMIADPDLFGFVEQNAPSLLSKKSVALAHIIRRSCEIKAEVVSADERETTGHREILNFGHTVGHAIENVAGYGEILHGEAVAMGLLAECRLSEKHLGFPVAESERLRRVLLSLRLPVDIPPLNREALLNAMSRDKKNRNGRLRFVLAEKIGTVRTGIEIPEREIFGSP
ncbi:MAG: 3-dehydroquinate synthase [Verrucomicrobiae bacterium]|nr:3-dehydroquinate synthase [Verrucomicrobiae bacterium]